jgi:hypothetical protein
MPLGRPGVPGLDPGDPVLVERHEHDQDIGAMLRHAIGLAATAAVAAAVAAGSQAR